MTHEIERREGEARPGMHLRRLLLLAVLLLAFAVRMHHLGAQSLWYDEAVTAHVGSQGIAELTRWTADDIQPPLYYYAVAGWTCLAGSGEWALRFPSAVFGTLIAAALYALASRLFAHTAVSRTAALIAGALAAISPLYVYYAQEARMYALLTFLGILAGYALLRAMEAVRAADAARWWVAFAGVSAAMLYTHYFGVFLLLAYGLFFLAIWILSARQRTPAWAQLGLAGASGAAIVLLYVPWLPAVLARYRLDRSYWQGALKLDEALRHVATKFTTGSPETMLESDAIRLLPLFGLALITAIVALVLWGRPPQGVAAEEQSRKFPRLRLTFWSTLLFLLLYFAVPVVGVLALASRTPKFNARYLMLASPALWLLLAGGIGALADLQSGSQEARLTARRVAAALLLLALGAASAWGLHNWFSALSFTKAQWREAAATVRAQITPGEALLLVSGHAWPAWDYYAHDIPVVRLPNLDVLDIDATLGFDTGAVLGQALRGKTGAWVVEWQSDTVDPAGFLSYFLDRAGTEDGVSRPFWQLALRHWQLQPDATYPARPQPAHVDGANYGHKLALLGWDDPRRGKMAVYWQALNTMPDDYKISLVLEDARGVEVGRWDGRPAGYGFPTNRWSPGHALVGRYPLPLPAGAPAGEYYVTLAVYDDSAPSGLDIMDVADNPAGKRVRLGPFNVAK